MDKDMLTAVSREFEKALEREREADTDTRRAFCAGMSEAYKHVLEYLFEKKPDPEGPDSWDNRRFMKGVLEREVWEISLDFKLAAMACNDGVITGYFTRSAAPLDAYVHIWEVKIDLERRIEYPDTLREVMLVPIDGYRFPDGVILMKEAGELERMGFAEFPEEEKPF
jgi:hypothetical protein